MEHNSEIVKMTQLLDGVSSEKEKLINETNQVVKQLFLKKDIDKLKDLYKETYLLLEFYDKCEIISEEWRTLSNEIRD